MNTKNNSICKLLSRDGLPAPWLCDDPAGRSPGWFIPPACVLELAQRTKRGNSARFFASFELKRVFSQKKRGILLWSKCELIFALKLRLTLTYRNHEPSYN